MKVNLTKIARLLRKKSTPQEIKLWRFLRGKRLANLKFRRQYAIDHYVVDFCCPEKRLIIELDGGGHNEEHQIKLDQDRDQYLKNQGFRILRIWNNEVDDNLKGVLDEILEITKK